MSKWIGSDLLVSENKSYFNLYCVVLEVNKQATISTIKSVDKFCTIINCCL